ncbi:MAG: cell division protein FtsQ/DivIB [bacterium]
MKSIYTNIKINNDNVKRNKRHIAKEKEPRRIWVTILHGFITLIVSSIAILAGIQLFLFLFYSSYFNLSRIEVSSMKEVDKQEILALVNIKPNSNLLTLRTGAIINKVSAHPWVEKVRIQKQLPNRVRIEVLERKPIAVICGKDNFGIDAAGYLLPDIRLEEVRNLPLITVADNAFTSNPERITTPAMTNALFAIQYLRDNNLSFMKEISELNIVSPDNLVIYTLHEGTEIRLGNENLEERLVKLQQVWEIIKQQQLVEEYIDLRFDRQGIVTKPKNRVSEKTESTAEPELKT